MLKSSENSKFVKNSHPQISLKQHATICKNKFMYSTVDGEDKCRMISTKKKKKKKI